MHLLLRINFFPILWTKMRSVGTNHHIFGLNKKLHIFRDHQMNWIKLFQSNTLYPIQEINFINRDAKRVFELIVIKSIQIGSMNCFLSTLQKISCNWRWGDECLGIIDGDYFFFVNFLLLQGSCKYALGD